MQENKHQAVYCCKSYSLNTRTTNLMNEEVFILKPNTLSFDTHGGLCIKQSMRWTLYISL